MGTTIDGIGLASASFRHRKSALHLADVASTRAIADAGLEPDDVDLLINCGLYRDRNLGEPALAALVQEDVGINQDDPHEGGHGTFSFDLANGVCGALTGLQIIDRFARAGTIRHGLVVASDADPGHGLAAEFPYTPAGGALVCSWTDDERGLGAMRWLSWSDDGASYRSTVGQGSGRNRLEFHVDAAYFERAGAAAAKIAAQVLDDEGLRVDDVDVVVLAPADATLGRTFAEHSGFSTGQLIVASDTALHTASIIVALDAARASGRLPSGTVALLVCASAGITAGACTYRV